MLGVGCALFALAHFLAYALNVPVARAGGPDLGPVLLQIGIPAFVLAVGLYRGSRLAAVALMVPLAIASLWILGACVRDPAVVPCLLNLVVTIPLFVLPAVIAVREWHSMTWFGSARPWT